jgi:nonribosomal peptide synthetase CepK
VKANDLHPEQATFLDVWRTGCAAFAHAEFLRTSLGVYTYESVDMASNRLAAHLADRGIAKSSLVALALPRGFDFVVSVLAVLKCGAAYVPLDLAHPRARLENVLTASGVSALLTHDSELGAGKTPRVSPQASKAGTVSPVISADDWAYVIYTSGSTGAPKGVAVTHRGIPNLAQQASLYGIGQATRVLMFSPVGFDASVAELAMVVFAGGTLVVLSDAELKDPSVLEQAIQFHGIEVVTLPPSFATLLDPEKCSALKTLIVAGESCTQSVIDTWSTRVRLLNAYGPTEATVATTVALCTHNSNPRVIGRPISGVTLSILDENGNSVAPGTLGELAIGGKGVADGYLGDRAHTLRAFPTLPGRGRVFLTGDFGCELADGSVEFHGRRDQQVKIAGNRVELGELEATVMSLGGVRECVVIFEQGFLCLFVVKNTESALTEEAVRRHLQAQLPSYFTPQKMVWLSKLPRNIAGKVDRSKLVSAPLEAPPTSITDLSSIEAELASHWSELLKRPVQAAGLNFFTLGGNSLLVIRLAARLKKEGYALSIRDLFAHPTLRQMAAQMVASRKVEHLSIAKGV